MRSTATAADIRLIPLADIERDAPALIQAHWEEVALSKDIMVLDPDWDRYRHLERQRALLCLGAFDGDTLVGYSIGAVMPHLHYRNLIFYQNDVFFLAKEHRRNKLGERLIEESEAHAQSRGAQFFCWHAKKDSAADRMFARKVEHGRYAVQDIIYSRRAD
jgi:GNAT superfamily N-acetyltransferase